MTKCALGLFFLLPVVALALPADARDRRLYDPHEPGSVIVFPEFDTFSAMVDGVLLPATEIEVGVVCPHRTVVNPDGTRSIINETCAEHQPVKIRYSWVCPPARGTTNQICSQNNFEVVTSVNGKVVFDPENLTITGSNSVNVPRPPSRCSQGYLIGWAINPVNDQPIKFDGLIGDEVVRASRDIWAA